MDQEKNNIDIIHHLPRLRWACRRGMLELDVLLGNFLEKGYQRLSDDDKRIFIRLLECTDPELFSWLMGKESPPDADFSRLVDAIKHDTKF